MLVTVTNIVRGSQRPDLLGEEREQSQGERAAAPLVQRCQGGRVPEHALHPVPGAIVWQRLYSCEGAHDVVDIHGPDWRRSIVGSEVCRESRRREGLTGSAPETRGKGSAAMPRIYPAGWDAQRNLEYNL